MTDPNAYWTYDELVALLGTSKKAVVTSEPALHRMVELLNGGGAVDTDTDDPAHPYDEIALRAMVGLLASGLYPEDTGAAGVVAWTVCLPGFLRGKAMFLEKAELYLATAIPNTPSI